MGHPGAILEPSWIHLVPFWLRFAILFGSQKHHQAKTKTISDTILGPISNHVGFNVRMEGWGVGQGVGQGVGHMRRCRGSSLWGWFGGMRGPVGRTKKGRSYPSRAPQPMERRIQSLRTFRRARGAVACGAPRWPQDGPKMAPRWPQDGPKTAPRWPQKVTK